MAFCNKSLLLFFTIAFAISAVAAKHIRRTSQQSSDILPDGYIGGGAPVTVGQFPWMVRFSIFKRKTNFRCGGSLIDDRHVISAAHCFEGVKSYSNVRVYLGEYNVDTFPTDCVEGKCTENIMLHADRIYWNHYNSTTKDNDIVVLRLEERVQLSDTIQPIALPTSDPEDTVVGETGASVVVAGWGMDENEILSNVLLSTELNILNRTICLLSNKKMLVGLFCAATPNATSSACKGDSGGPLMMFHHNKYYLTGIFSYYSYLDNKVCPPAMSYYTNVYKHLKFIRKALENSNN